MKQDLTKEKVKEFMKIKGETRGFTLKQDAKWVLGRMGGKGLLKLEKKTEEMGCPIRYKDIKSMDFYPVGMIGVSLLAIKDLFNLEKEDIKKLCSYNPRGSLIIKFLMESFFTIEEMVKKAPAMWKRYMTEGEVEIVSHDDKKKRIVGRIKNFDLDPSLCVCLEGYFENLVGMVTGNPDVSCKEVKCTFKGDPYHEYVVDY